jgi:hypothetical protein
MNINIFLIYLVYKLKIFDLSKSKNDNFYGTEGVVVVLIVPCTFLLSRYTFFFRQYFTSLSLSSLFYVDHTFSFLLNSHVQI